MNSLKRGPQVSPVVAAVIISLLIVGVAGGGLYIYRMPVKVVPQPATAFETGGRTPEQFAKTPRAPAPTPEALAARYRHTAALLKLVAGLGALQRGKEPALSREQTNELLPVLQRIQTAESLTEIDCAQAVKEIKGALNEAQSQAVDEAGTTPSFEWTPPQPFASGEAKKQLESLVEGLQKAAS